MSTPTATSPRRRFRRAAVVHVPWTPPAHYTHDQALDTTLTTLTTGATQR